MWKASSTSTETNKSKASNKIERVTLYEEYRLIEKNESEISGAWKRIHLLFFFLAFIFGSFCTFCFHMLMYLFDEKCVLFPKLISLREGKDTIHASPSGSHTSNKLFLDYVSNDPDSLPVDFVSTHWVDKSTCYLPTYAPLLSGICGLIWTTMFLMCSSGSRALTGLQRPWRILPTVFVFSLAMGGLCLYTTIITHTGLNELCTKLAEITGSPTCTYTINVATLAYERRIRGVYQATRLTIMSAWLHTGCWLAAAFTALIRVILVVDFRLVKVKAQLRGNIEKMLERQEKLIKTDEFSNKDDFISLRHNIMSTTSLKVRFVNKGFGTEIAKRETTSPNIRTPSKETVHLISKVEPYPSDMALEPDEDRKLTIRMQAENHRFIVKMLHEIVDSVEPNFKPLHPESTKSRLNLHRQQGMHGLTSIIWSPSSSSDTDESVVNAEEAAKLAKEFRHELTHKLSSLNLKLSQVSSSTLTPLLSPLKSNLKERAVQTDEQRRKKLQMSSTASVQTLKNPIGEHEWKALQRISRFILPDAEIEKLVRDENLSIYPMNLSLLSSFLSSLAAFLMEQEDTLNIPLIRNPPQVHTRLDSEEPGPSHSQNREQGRHNDGCDHATKENPKKSLNKEKQD